MAEKTDEEAEPVTDGGTPGVVGRVRQFWDTATSDLAETDDRCAQMADAETKTMERHSLGNRISHWLQVVLFVLLAWTGFAIWYGEYAILNLLESGIWDGYYVAFGIHMWAGILTLAVTFVIFPYYYVIVDDHGQFLEMPDIQVGVAISAAFVGLRKYLPYYHDARRAYDEDEGDWMAHHPMQKTFFWWIAIFIGLLALTGFGMYAEMTAEPPVWIGALGFMAGLLSFELLKQIHLFLAFITVSMVIFHIYFAAMPSNWDILKSMVYGDIEAKIVHGDEANDDGSVAADGGEESQHGSEPADD
jgi:Ni/Fe-hydrogenase 1 B-type cytochrome subunit